MGNGVGVVDGVAPQDHERKLPVLPSIKESMPFLSSLKENEVTTGKEHDAGTGSDMPARRDAAPIMHLHPTPPFGSNDPRDKDSHHRLPPLVPSSATPSTNSSPSVCPQCPPSCDPAKADLKAHNSNSPSAPSQEGEVPDRVGNLDWGERRKKVKREQTFGVVCPRSQRIAHLKLAIVKLSDSLPYEAKESLLETLKR